MTRWSAVLLAFALVPLASADDKKAELKLTADEEAVIALTNAERKKAEKELFAIFESVDGEFTFTEAEMPSLDLLPMRVDVSKMLLRVTQDMDEKGEYDFDSTGIRLEIPRDV